jgi:hypothetical protein
MAAQSPGTGAATRSFAAHLQTLRDFAEELREQVRALGAHRETVVALSAEQVRTGDFLEAGMLRDRHTRAVAQLESLVDGIERAILFAEDVTHTVATSYGRSDDQVAAFFGAGSAR